MTDAYVLGGVRTPVGRHGGSLSHIRTDDLLGQTMVWACERVGADPGRIEDIAAGCVNVAHEGRPRATRDDSRRRSIRSRSPGAGSSPRARSSTTESIGDDTTAEKLALNPNGGAVAIGHPLGASGTRYVLTLATELRERSARYGVLGVCVGSGQGVALVLENPSA